MTNETNSQKQPVELEADAQELEEMDAPDWSTASAAAISAAAVSVGVAIT